jgi:hypothetical protein
MFFIWTSNGGPLQYVGLAFMMIQFLPHMMSSISTPMIIGFLLPLGLGMVTYGWQRGQARGLMTQWTSQARDAIRQLSGVTVSDRAILRFFGGVAVAVLTLWAFGDMCWVSFGFQIVTIGCMHYFYVARDPARSEAERQQAKLSELVKVVQTMPIEEFVPEETMSTCSLSQLKQMLRVRGKEVETPLELQDLVEALRDCRNYCDTCCICCEEYQEGDPLRILPKCRHEFHLECLDQWTYTFADKRQRDPSCPLCNESLNI